jgi:hypothetical protein
MLTYFKNWVAILTVGIGFPVVGSQLASAQCSSGNCGNVGYADGFGGYVSAPYGVNHSHIQSGMSHATNGGYGTWGHRQVNPLFNNYFTQGNANQADAALYVSPIGNIPGWVGHTYGTYQPLYSDEFLYHHTDKYHSYYDQGQGLNRTKAKYWAPPVHTALKQIYHKIELPR